MTSQPPPDPYGPGSPPPGDYGSGDYGSGDYGYGAPPPGNVPPPPPPPPGYGYGYPPPPPPRGTNTMAIVALIMGFVFSPLAIVFGHIAKKQIRETGEEGDGLATAGLVLGYVFTGLAVAFCCVYGIIIIGLFGAAGAASV